MVEGAAAPSEILTPSGIREKNPPKDFLVYTKKYGETQSVLNPKFERGLTKIEGRYEVKMPEAVIGLCREVRGLGGRALLVGGGIRDAVILAELGEASPAPADLDLEVFGLSLGTVQKVLEGNFGAGNIKTTGKAFEVFKVKIGGLAEPLDVGVPRRDSKTGVGHKGFTVSGDPRMTINEAALRRDLTINSLAFDPLTKTLYDPYGGVGDIKSRVIEATDAGTFREDPLRVLRIAQFGARFKFAVSERTENLCRQMVDSGELDYLPRERVTGELEKLLLKGRRPSLGLEFARRAGLTERYWSELNGLFGLFQEEAWHPEGDVWAHTLQTVDAAARIADREGLSVSRRRVLMLSALCHDLGKPPTTELAGGVWTSHGHERAGVKVTQEFFKKFAFPQEVERQVLALVPDHLAPKYFWEQEVKGGANMDRAVRRLAVRLARGRTSIEMLSLLAEADQRGRNGGKDGPLPREDVVELEAWQTWLGQKTAGLKLERGAPRPLLNGQTLMDSLGVKESHISVGAVLRCVFEDQLDGKVVNAEQALGKGEDYWRGLKEEVGRRVGADGKTAREIWSEIRYAKDPRVCLSGKL